MDKLFYPSLAVAFLALIAAFTHIKTLDVHAMQQNISTAIEKGIDPIAVRCAYADRNDNVCVAYAISHKEIPPQDPPKKK